jgi:N-glycosylase/DNA lyase
MTQTFIHRFERAVTAICPDIQARIAMPRRAEIDDRALWWELSCCILSSQVPYPVATAAADAIEKAELLLPQELEPHELATALEDVLTHHVVVGGRSIRYRFPGSRAKQLAAAHLAVHRRDASLSTLLATFADASEARRWLVNNVPGAGPKQSSMFLRNVGLTYSLAILDRHVLKYMSALGISDHTLPFVSGMSTYLRLEQTLREHATRIGYEVGLLDWAIWIVMRADKQPNMELDFA